jgi:hypothetical protein
VLLLPQLEQVHAGDGSLDVGVDSIFDLNAVNQRVQPIRSASHRNAADHGR